MIAEPELVVFDADGTLVESFTETMLPGVQEWFSAVIESPKPPRVAIATNQGGVGLRLWMESWNKPQATQDAKKYPTIKECEDRFSRISNGLWPVEENDNPFEASESMRVYMAFAFLTKKGTWSVTPPEHKNDPRFQRSWRKPSWGMLKQAALDVGADPKKCIFVGNGREDEEAAKGAGFEFHDADVWFGRKG